MTKQKRAQKAKASATIQEDLKPLITKLDDVCDRLELIEAIAELLYVWKQADIHEVQITTHCFGVLGNFIREESYEMRHQISGEAMDRLSVIENRKEARL